MTKQFANKKPAGFRIDNRSEQVACPHRDLSCCVECVNTYSNIVEVYGAFYWMRSKAELAEHTAFYSLDAEPELTDEYQEVN